MIDPEQMEFKMILDKKGSQPVVTPKPKLKPSKRKNIERREPQFSVVLTHEEGVNWRLDCLQKNDQELEPSYYGHLAREGLKLELLRMLKQDKPDLKDLQIIALMLVNLGADVPEFLQVDSNKNLFEGDFWSDFELSEKKNFKGVCSSFLWAFYFKDFDVNTQIVSREFTEFPADETDLMFLLDCEILTKKYPGLSIFN